jgi:glutamate 5-kinase
MPTAAHQARRVVVKLGTGTLTSGIGCLDTDRIGSIARQIAALRSGGREVAVVSSGAVGLGMGRLGLKRRPSELRELQACAAVGQGILIQTWQSAFTPHDLPVAQILLTHDDLRVRTRHLAVKETLEHLLRIGVIPVINENDTVSTEEIKFGDNDTLSAMVASLLGADLLVILSTAPGLIDRKGTGKILPVVESITPEIEAMAGGTESPTAVGGMISKISAAKLATRSGCGMIIASGDEPDVLGRIVSGDTVGTFFLPCGLPMAGRKRWLAFFQRPKGTLILDAGATLAVRQQRKSLLAPGIRSVEGSFLDHEVVNIAGPDGIVFARGTSILSSEELRKLAGKSSAEVRSLLQGIKRRPEVVHRDTLVLL